MLTSTLDDTFTHFGGFFSSFMGSWLLNFTKTRHACILSFFRPFRHTNYIEVSRSVMPKPVFLMTLQEAHKEYNSLTDQKRDKYEQLDSGEFGTVDTQAFTAEACELANLLAHVSQLCQKLNLPPPKELYRPTVFKH